LCPLVINLLGDCLVAHELLGTREIAFGKSQIGTRKEVVGARLRQRILEGPLIDAEKKVAFRDDLAIGEVYIFERAGNTGAHLDRIDRDKAADIFILLGNNPLHRFRDGHRGRRRRGGLLLALAASSQQQRKRKERNNAHGN
jgi:hypothetical protein